MIRRFVFCVAALTGLASHVFAAPLVPVGYTYSSGPWQYWDDSGNDLLDSVLAGPETGDPIWVGFSNSSATDFDFGSVVAVGALSIHAFDRDGGAGIDQPGEVRLSTSPDNSFYTQVASYPVSSLRLVESGEQGITGWIDLDFPTRIETQYLRVTLTPGPVGPWMFTSEFQFQSVPEPASLTLLSVCGLVIAGHRRRAR